MGLTRKKVTVRTKKGKTFQRSVMVRAEAIGKRAGGKKLNSLNPWEAHHTELVKGRFPKSSGTSGPGSDHSWFAHLVGATRQTHKAQAEPPPSTDGWRPKDLYTGTAAHATDRQAAGRAAVSRASEPLHNRSVAHVLDGAFAPRSTSYVSRGMEERYGRENIHEVHQDPRRHVR